MREIYAINARQFVLRRISSWGLVWCLTLFHALAFAEETQLDFSLDAPNIQKQEAFDTSTPPKEVLDTPTKNGLGLSPPTVVTDSTSPNRSPLLMPPKNSEILLGIEQLIDPTLSTKLEPRASKPLQTPESTPLNITLETLENEAWEEVETLKHNHITILKVVDYRDDKALKIDSNSRISLNKTLLDAIDHDILLNFNIQMQLTESNRLFGFPYQRVRKDIDYHVQLFAFGINRQFMLYNSRNNQLQTFKQLHKALETLATIKEFAIAELSEMHPRQNYTLKIRISLDRWKLPPPLMLDALFSNDWTLDSGWFETTLTAPQSWQ